MPVYCYCAGNMYGLSHPNRYRKAIGDEPARLADRRIREILDTPYPKAFWRLWSTDVAHWLSDGKPQIGKESIPMSIATLIERIVGKQRERQAADFRDVVVWVADGKEPDPDFVSQCFVMPTSRLTTFRRPWSCIRRVVRCGKSGKQFQG